MIGIRISVHSVFSACLVLLLLAPAHAWALSSTPVTVVNPTTAPVPTVQQNTGDAAAANAKAMGVQTPFVVQGFCLFGGRNSCAQPIATVPANQRWVFEDFEFSCTFPGSGATVTRVSFDAVAGGTPYGVYINPLPATTTTPNGGRVIRAYADPGSSVILDFVLSNIVDDGSCNASIIGQAIDVP